jgi:hypothetical protein
MNIRPACLLFASLLHLAVSAHAVQVAGVDVPEQIELHGMQKPLQLNGAGVRKKLFIDVYVAALYLPERNGRAETLLRRPPPNRVLMHVVCNKISRAKMGSACEAGFSANLASEDYQALQARLEQFMAMFEDLERDGRVWLDYLPGEGTRVSINGEVRGVVAGQDFNAALLSVWLGQEPVTSALKKALLGADS